jgi:hypothetical protein
MQRAHPLPPLSPLAYEITPSYPPSQGNELVDDCEWEMSHRARRYTTKTWARNKLNPIQANGTNQQQTQERNKPESAISTRLHNRVIEETFPP